MSTGHAAAKDHKDVSGLYCHLRPWGYLAHTAALLGAMSGSLVLWQLGSMLKSKAQAYVTIKGHAFVPGMDCCLKDCGELPLPLICCGVARERVSPSLCQAGELALKL